MQHVRIYARVSTDEQAKKNTSIPAQLSELKTYCKTNKMEIQGIYIDNGISASTIKKRDGLKKLLNDVKTNELILFTKLDRLSRNILDANLIVQKLNKENIGIRAILESDNNIDTSSADGKFMFDLMVSLAERERSLVSERIKFSFEHKKLKKEPLGKVPFGYILKDKKAIIDKKNADIVKDTFDVFIQTKNITKTQRIINEMYNIQKGRSFYQKILNKKAYTGIVYDIPDFYPPIISEETFLTAESLRSNQYTRTTKHNYLFSGLCFCSCGCRMNPTTQSKQLKSGKKVYKVYRCSSKALGKGNCTNSIYEGMIEKKLIDQLEPYLKEEIQLETTPIKKQPIDPKPIKQKIERLKTLYIDGIMDKKEFDTKYQDLQKQLSIALKSTKSDHSNHKKALSEWKSIKNHYFDLTEQEKSIFWKALLNKIEIDKNKDIKFSIL